MTGVMKINGRDAYATWGAFPERGTMAAFLTPAPAKEYIVNSSPLLHGEIVATQQAALPKDDKRQIQIPICIVADTEAQFLTRYQSFVQELQKRMLDIELASIPNTVFRCKYMSCQQFAQYNGTMAKFSLKLEEPNPQNRAKE